MYADRGKHCATVHAIAHYVVESALSYCTMQMFESFALDCDLGCKKGMRAMPQQMQNIPGARGAPRPRKIALTPRQRLHQSQRSLV